MLFTLCKASDCKFQKEIEINDLNELIDIVDKTKAEDNVDDGVIIWRDEDGKLNLMIYDDYIE